MSKVFLIATIVSAFAVSTAFTTSKTNSTKTEISLPSDYCEGWEDGYCEGWKDIKGSMSMCPMTPMCPMAEFGKDRYRDGYNRGFRAGSRVAQTN